MKKRIVFSCIAVLLVLTLLAGCAAKNDRGEVSYATGNSYDYAKPAEEPAAAEESVDMNWETDDVSTATDGELDNPASVALVGRKIIETAYLSVQTLDYDAFIPNLNEVVSTLGGYVQSSSTSGRGYDSSSRMRWANIVVRVPNDKLKTFLSQMSEIGNVVNASTNAEDVTLNYVDTESRLSSFRTEQETLMGLLEKAQSMEDILTIQQRLTEVRYQIESYESTLRTLDDQINYSTVTIDIQEVERQTPVVEETPGEEISRKFRESLEDVGDGFVNFGVWFVGNLPEIVVWVVIVGGLTTVIVLICRGGKKRRAKRAARRAAKAAAKEAAKKDA